MNWLSHPYRPALGKSAMSERERHIKDMLELVLFTAPNERVHRPDFGCQLNQLIFLGNSPELALTVEMTIRSSVQRWLGELLTIERLEVRSDDAALVIELDYLIRASGEPGSATLTRPAL